MRLKTIIALFAIFLPSLLFCSNALAGNRAGAVNFSLNYGLYMYEGDQNLRDDLNQAYGVGIGYNLSENFEIEALINRITGTDYENTDNEIKGLLTRAEALYHLMPDSPVVPYVAFGVGNMELNPERGPTEDTFGAIYGVGIKFFMDEFWALRFDVRHFIGFDQGVDEWSETDNNLLATLGVNLQLGGQKPASAPRDTDGDGVTDDLDKCPDTPKGVSVDASGCPLDSDGDGVPDYLDKCPDTPKGVAVDTNGCELDSDGDGVCDSSDKCPNTPKGVEVDENGCPPDTDGDGVPDYLDKCPDTPKGAPVDRVGCPLDSDGDGVYDYLDRCPGTAKGIMVDEKGCPLSFTLEIEFDNNKADIRPVYHDRMAEAAAFIAKYPAPQILIAGHTDSSGSDAYNQKLSERRAANVRQYLIDNFGIKSDKLVAKGYGESQPIASNETAAGRQKNRRVEVVCCAVIPK